MARTRRLAHQGVTKGALPRATTTAMILGQDMSTAKHWNTIYGGRDEKALTWFQANPDEAVTLIRGFAAPGDPIIDAGGGTSQLVDGLLGAGLGPVTVLDLSEQALGVARARLQDATDAVTWIVADITRWQPDRPYKVWHDRAVFHFLRDAADQRAYLRTLDRALQAGGVAIIETFDDKGPKSCSGLPVQRYSPADLVRKIELLAPDKFTRISATRKDHVTPMGNIQSFQTSVFRKR
jgi:2-polyprenyl-3-methyl-5-hydroxy-6-metoxy-1,4-benzoquinol methylase